VLPAAISVWVRARRRGEAAARFSWLVRPLVPTDLWPLALHRRRPI